MLRGLVVVAAFAAYDEIADDLFFVADLPDEAAGRALDLVGVEAEPLRNSRADDGGLGCLGGHGFRSGGGLLFIGGCFLDGHGGIY